MATKRVIANEQGHICAVEVENLETKEVETLEVDLVLLAMGFLHPEQGGIIEKLGLELDGRKNIASSDKMQSSIEKIFVAGDATTGASLVVRAIASGRNAAKAINAYLKK